MFRTAPGPTITRPRFLTTMRHAYDFKIAEIDNKSDSRILGLLNRLFDAFDDDQKDEIEWRTWLVMYHITVCPNVDFRRHLQWAYCLFASAGTFDETGDRFGLPVRYENVRGMINLVASKPMRVSLLQAFDKAWLDLMAIFPDLSRASREAKKAGQSANSVKFDREQCAYSVIEIVIAATALCSSVRPSVPPSLPPSWVPSCPPPLSCARLPRPPGYRSS